MKLNFLQKLTIAFTHPAKIITHIIFLTLFFYSLWTHWILGITLSIVIMLAGDIYAHYTFQKKENYNANERVLLHLAKPVRFFWMIAGFLLMSYGAWTRDINLIIMSLILELVIIIYVLVYEPR